MAPAPIGGPAVETFYLLFAAFLLLTLAGGMARIIRGPTAVDRLLAAQLLGTTGVAILLSLAEALQRPGPRDVALVFALLAALHVGVFVGRGSPRTRGGEGGAP